MSEKHKIKPALITDVIEVLSKTRAGRIIFHDCFRPIAVQADKDKIREWISNPLPDEYKQILLGYLKWADKHDPVHPVEKDLRFYDE